MTDPQIAVDFDGCNHRSHRLRLRCWRWFVYDGYCARHNDSCWGQCPTGLEP
ncbi:hypothetical protein [Streptomyces stelliscabiei]|uniref:hypothetical protein n=1 Tax=Streptomyces stelliscabiei TaxID=146820 RepID=UPI0029A6478A|nr:hypothetical protein [Streptomyces stelliscabiei]MDX2550159.1 hypothetical protein [Streptomyces stelliscabiei]